VESTKQQYIKVHDISINQSIQDDLITT